MPPIDVVVADRYPSVGVPVSERGSLVGLVMAGFAAAPSDGQLLWISPSAGEESRPPLPADARLSVRCAPVSRAAYDTYYLTVGAERLWTVLHGLATELPADAAADDAWKQFLAVNHAVATAAAGAAPERARITVHDYTLLMSVPLIRQRRPDASFVYVHHTPWPHSDQVSSAGGRSLLQQLARAMGSSDVVVVSAAQWKRNLESWAPGVPVTVVPPAVDVPHLRQQARAASGGEWAETVQGSGRRPILAAVGRADPCKNFDAMLRAWSTLVRDGVAGTFCLHLIPTTRRDLPLYREHAESLASAAAEANRGRPGAVVVVERHSQSNALWLLQHADIVIACSRADGWNLVAVEASAIGPDWQRLILSSQVGAADLIGGRARIVQDPGSEAEIAASIRAAIEETPAATGRRQQLSYPGPDAWWRKLMALHRHLS